MRILALDHFFGQDIDALEYGARGAYEFKRVSYQYFRDKATEYFPPAVFDGPYEYQSQSTKKPAKDGLAQQGCRFLSCTESTLLT
jgi:hypothetical protein